MDCQQTMEKITELLVATSLDGPTLSLIKAHLAHCLQCREETAATRRVWNLLQCEAFQESLPELAEMSDVSLMDQHPEYWEHLQTCHECLDSLKTLRGLVADEKAGLFDPVPKGLTFGDLVKSRKKNREKIWDLSRSGIRKLAVDLKVLISRNTAIFQEIPMLLQPFQPAPAAMPVRIFRSLDSKEKPLIGPEIQQLVLPDEKKKRTILIVIRVSFNDTIDLLVRMTDAEQEQPLLGIQVYLYDSKHRILQHTVTANENEGTVEFSGLDPASYLIRLEEAELSWEVPLTLTSATGEQSV
jgi:hypothetical protein